MTPAQDRLQTCKSSMSLSSVALCSNTADICVLTAALNPATALTLRQLIKT